MASLRLWKYNRITGLWNVQRTVLPETKDEWLAIFRRDEPKETFVVSASKPFRAPKEHGNMLDARLRRLGVTPKFGNMLSDSRGTFIDEIESWAEGGAGNVNHWTPIARDAGVPMSELRAANKALATAERQGRTEGTLDRLVRRRRELAQDLIEQVTHASREQVDSYWRHFQYFMGR